MKCDRLDATGTGEGALCGVKIAEDEVAAGDTSAELDVADEVIALILFLLPICCSSETLPGPMKLLDSQQISDYLLK